MAKKECNCADWGLLLTRVVVAFVFLWHGFPKATDFALASSKFVAMGFPGFLGPIVGIVEVVAGILILVGFYHKWANYVLAIVIAVAIVGVQLPKGVTAGLERDLLVLAANLTLAWIGPGKYVVKKE